MNESVRTRLIWLAIVCGLAVAAAGSSYVVRHLLQSQAQAAKPAPVTAASHCPRVDYQESTIAIMKLQAEVSAQKTRADEAERRLITAVRGWSESEIRRAGLNSNHPSTIRRGRIGSATVTVITPDTVWIREDDGAAKPYTIGQPIPGAGRLLGIDAVKGEAITEQARLLVATLQTPWDLNSRP